MTRGGKNCQVAVIGTRGFIGAALVRRLTVADVDAVSIGSNEVDLLAPNATIKLKGRIETASTAVFCSAITPDKAESADSTELNLHMCNTFRDAVYATRHTHVVYLSSDVVYPYGTAPVDEATAIAPESSYGAMHAGRETLLSEALGDRLLIARLTQVYGANDTHNAYGPCRMARQAVAEGRIELFGNGEERRDHIDIDDVTALLQRLIGQRATGVINVVTGQSRSFVEIADIVRTHVPGCRLDRLPRKVAIKHREFDDAGLRRRFPDFNARSPEDGIARMIECLRMRKTGARQ